MAFKLVTLCALMAFAQATTAQCVRTGLANIGLTRPSYGSSGYGLALKSNGLAANSMPGNGAGLIVTSASPLAPTGLAVLSENLELAGPVSVGGQLPLLAAVTLEGQLPAVGQAGANYGCGNDNIGLVSERVIAPGSVVSSGFATRAGLGRGVGGLRSAGFGAALRSPRRPCGAF